MNALSPKARPILTGSKIPVSIGLILLGFLLFSCKKKEEDTTLPIITFETPEENSAYQFAQTIHTRVHVTDDRQIKAIRMDITDAWNNVIFSPASISVPEGSNDRKIEHSFSFTDEKILSGVYYIRVIADDGENIQTVYRQINLTGAARAVEQILVQRADNAGNTITDHITAIGLQPYGLANFSTYAAGYYSSLSDFSCVSDPVGNISVYREFYFELYSFLGAWLNVENAYTATFIDYQAQEFWMGGKTGYIVHLKNNGQLQVAQTSGGSAEEILALRRQGEYLIYVSKNIVTGNYRIYTCLADNLQTLHSTELPFAPIALLGEDNELTTMIACNEGAQGSFKHYYIPDNVFSDVFFFYNDSPITKAWTGPNGKNYVVHDNGISVYESGMNTWVESAAAPPLQIHFNEVDGSVILVYSNQILFMDESLQTEIASENAENIRDVWILYNK